MESAMLSACSLKALSLLNHTEQSAFPWSSSSVCICTYVCICIYRQYLSISVNICPGPISGSNLTGTNLRVQSQGSISDVHICAYVLISYNICVYQIYICAYICIFLIIWLYLCISVHICLYQVYIRQYLCVSEASELYPCIYTYICAYLCIYVYIQKLHFEGKKPNF